MTRRQRREAVKSLILARDFEGLYSLAAEHADTATYAVAFVFERDDLLRWRAIEALGRLSGYMAGEGELEKVRGIVRRLLWLMNDESGGIAWNGPEAIGEILFNTPALIGEYGRIIASFVDAEPFGLGTLWAIARTAELDPSEFEASQGTLRRSLGSPQAEERGHALLSLFKLNPELARRASENLLDDTGRFQVYDFESGNLDHITVGDIARSIKGKPARAV